MALFWRRQKIRCDSLINIDCCVYYSIADLFNRLYKIFQKSVHNCPKRNSFCVVRETILYGIKNLLLRTVYLKIPFRESSIGAGINSMAKCLTNLGVNGFLPPPGGAHATVKTTSSICFQNSFSLSYIPWKSSNCLCHSTIMNNFVLKEIYLAFNITEVP